MLLQILDDGILTDSQGRRVDFKNCIIIMTSNVGAKLIAGSGSSLGFGEGDGSGLSDEKIRENVMGELKATFRPEFLNRVDDIIVFRKLTQEDIREIAARLLKNLSDRVRALDVELTFSDEAITRIADAGFDPVYGARPLRRAIQSKIEDLLSEQMLEGKVTAGKSYQCEVNNEQFVFTEKAKTAETE